MRPITPHLVRFAVVTAILTLTFRYFLSTSLENERYVLAFLSAAAYFAGVFAIGWHQGKREKRYLPIYDIGFRIHLATYLVFVFVSEIWFIAGFHSTHEAIGSVHTTALIWGIFLAIHCIFYLMARRSSIKHLDRTDLFE